MKKLLATLLSLMIAAAVLLCPVNVSALSTYSGTLALNPGNTRSSAPNYNYAWLDNMIIRDDPMAATQANITPRPTDYLYSKTYDEFVKESEQYNALIRLDENTAADAYKELVNIMYYLVTAMGMTDKQEVMRQYLTEQGISLPANEGPETKAEIAVVYAAMKYDAINALYGKTVYFAKGTSLDGAVVSIVSAMTGTAVPSGIDSLSGLAVFATKKYVTQFQDLPISENPSTEEIFHWAKIITAASNDYKVPVEVYSETTAAQREYVDYAYYASLLSAAYDTHVDPVKLVVATQSTDSLAVQKLILASMLDEKGVDYSYDFSCKELFEMACEAGCFQLENEFYTDILRYDIEVAQNCEKIWFTTFPLADLLEGGSNAYLSMKLAGNPAGINDTTGISLDTTKAKETICLEVTYNAPSRQDSAVYEFNIIKNPNLNGQTNTSSQNNLVAGVEEYVKSIVPADSEKANSVVDSVFQSIDNNVTTSSASSGEGILTTFATDSQSATLSGSAAEKGESTTNRFDFAYLDELIGGVYATDENGNIVTKSSLPAIESTTEKANVIVRATAAVKENPEIVAAPTGIIAVGALAGYLMTKKHRDSEAYAEVKDEEIEDIDE
ncbi:MAG: hypothetical protein ACI4GB_04115 [Acutalibacteraceae bacterium]